MQVRIINVGSDLTDLPSEALKLAESNIQQLRWSSGGQLLSISTATGHLYCALGSLPAVAAAAVDSYAHLSSLNQATVCKALSGMQTKVALKFTPHFMALGQTHLAAGMNNRVLFYKIDGSNSDEPVVRMYDEGSVEALHMNSSLVAALMGGRVLVHGIEDMRAEAQVPYRGQDVSAFAVTEDFIVIGTSGGLLQHYSVKQGPLAPLNEYMHETRGGKRAGIVGVWAAPGSAHLVFADNSNKVHVFSCVDDQVRSSVRGCWLIVSVVWLSTLCVAWHIMPTLALNMWWRHPTSDMSENALSSPPPWPAAGTLHSDDRTCQHRTTMMRRVVCRLSLFRT